MEKKASPYKRFVCVCTNTRDQGQACANPGRRGDAIWAALKAGAAKAGLKGKVRVTRSGCLGLCEHGPNVLVYPEGEWYSGVKTGDVAEILKNISD